MTERKDPTLAVAALECEFEEAGSIFLVGTAGLVPKSICLNTCADKCICRHMYVYRCISSICMYMGHVCIYTYTYIHAYAYIYTYHMYMCIYMYMYMYIPIFIFLHACKESLFKHTRPAQKSPVHARARLLQSC